MQIAVTYQDVGVTVGGSRAGIDPEFKVIWIALTGRDGECDSSLNASGPGHIFNPRGSHNTCACRVGNQSQ